MFAVAGLIALTAIAPAFISLRIARAALDSPATVERTAADELAGKEAQNLIAALKPIAVATSSPSAAVTLALSKKPAGVSIQSITYTGGATPKITMTGTSKTRESLGAFRSALQATGAFSRVEVPVAALVGAQEGRFTLTLFGGF